MQQLNAITEGGKQFERIAPKIMSQAVEKVQKTCRLLGKFGRKKYNQAVRKVKD